MIDADSNPPRLGCPSANTTPASGSNLTSEALGRNNMIKSTKYVSYTPTTGSKPPHRRCVAATDAANPFPHVIYASLISITLKESCVALCSSPRATGVIIPNLDLQNGGPRVRYQTFGLVSLRMLVSRLRYPGGRFQLYRGVVSSAGSHNLRTWTNRKARPLKG